MKHHSLPAALFLFVMSPWLVLHAEEIQVSDIGGKVILIGRLGQPVGTLVANIEGQLISEPTQGKSGSITAALRVNKVDGKPLAKAQSFGVIFHSSVGLLNLHAKDLVKFSGYESGAFIGTPNAAREALGKDASPFEWKFESTVHVVKLL